MKSTRSVFKLLTGNLKVKCQWCGSKIKRKNAVVKNIKRLEFVYPKPTFFCSEKCGNNYAQYELSAPRSISMCNSCPVPDLSRRKSPNISENK
ncbi:MAG: hypothetical protein WDZ69_00830 [Candidatus Pacearchaeota archaeon]